MQWVNGRGLLLMGFGIEELLDLMEQEGGVGWG